jgi:hypothetical protein
MRPAEARDTGDAPDGRPVPVVWPGPAHAGNEKYLAGLWIIVAPARNGRPDAARRCGSASCAEERAARAEPGRGDGRRDHAEGCETESDVLTRVYQDLIVQPEIRA